MILLTWMSAAWTAGSGPGQRGAPLATDAPGPDLGAFAGLLQSGISLLLVLAVAWGLTRLLASWRGRARPAGRRLELVESLPLGGRRTVQIVRLDGRRELVIASSEAGVQMLAEHRAPAGGEVGR